MRRAASIPSSRGIFTSMIATSGRSERASSTASSPSRASAQTSNPDRSRRSLRSSRMIVSSSATSTRIGSVWHGAAAPGRALSGVVQLLQKVSELGEAIGSEPSGPGVLDLGDGIADHGNCAPPPSRDDDALPPLILGVGLTLEVAEALEL